MNFGSKSHFLDARHPYDPLISLRSRFICQYLFPPSLFLYYGKLNLNYFTKYMQVSECLNLLARSLSLTQTTDLGMK